MRAGHYKILLLNALEIYETVYVLSLIVFTTTSMVDSVSYVVPLSPISTIFPVVLGSLGGVLSNSNVNILAVTFDDILTRFYARITIAMALP